MNDRFVIAKQTSSINIFYPESTWITETSPLDIFKPGVPNDLGRSLNISTR